MSNHYRFDKGPTVFLGCTLHIHYSYSLPPPPMVFFPVLATCRHGGTCTVYKVAISQRATMRALGTIQAPIPPRLQTASSNTIFTYSILERDYIVRHPTRSVLWPTSKPKHCSARSPFHYVTFNFARNDHVAPLSCFFLSALVCAFLSLTSRHAYSIAIRPRCHVTHHVSHFSSPLSSRITLKQHSVSVIESCTKLSIRTLFRRVPCCCSKISSHRTCQERPQ